MIVTLSKLSRPAGARGVAAESLLRKHQLVIINRTRQRASNLTTFDRVVLGLATLLVCPHRPAKLSAIFEPATPFRFHKAVVRRNYQLLFSSSGYRRKPGSKGPTADVIAASVVMRRRNPQFGYMRIAQQTSHAFGVDIDKDVVRHMLAKHYQPGDSRTNDPSSLTFIGHTKDSLWSIDQFRCESILLRSHWVMVAQDSTVR